MQGDVEPFTAQIKQIIEYIDQFEHDQVRRVYDLFCLLCLGSVCKKSIIFNHIFIYGFFRIQEITPC